MAKHDATQPGRDAKGGVDPKNWSGKHVAASGADADRSQGKTQTDKQ